MHTARDDQNQSHGESHMSHAEKNKDMQKEIDRLKRELRHAKRKRSPSCSDEDFEVEQDVGYKQKHRTPVSESFTYEEMRHGERNPQNPLPRGAGNDAMSKALDQISRSPFTRNIEGAKLPSVSTSPHSPSTTAGPTQWST